MLRLVCAKRSSFLLSNVQGGKKSATFLLGSSGRHRLVHCTTKPRVGSVRLPITPGGSTRFVWAVPIVGYGVGCSYYLSKSLTTQCATTVVSTTPETSRTVVRDDVLAMEELNLWEKVRRGLRMLRRVIKLMMAFGPIATLYPLVALFHKRNAEEDAQDLIMAALERKDLPGGFLGWYYRMCLYSVEWSGAAAIKLFQWAGSRPDMFGNEFCRVFSQLQDDTTPHAWKHTERALREACKYIEFWTSLWEMNLFALKHIRAFSLHIFPTPI
jgi:hypothetical protein